MLKKPLIPVILGPTATGKTSLGIELARLIDGEIISVDSRKVYQGLPVGTATPSGSWDGEAYVVDGIAHYLMAHLPPDHPYTAGDFAKDTNRLIQSILDKNKTPILVGGTGFYFKALAHGLPALPPRDAQLRDKWNQQIHKEGNEKVHNQLREIDPEAADNIMVGDSHKIIRAFEIFELTGQPYSSWKGKGLQASPFSFAAFGLQMDKDVLDKRIEVRSQQMVERGMIEEAEVLIKKGYSKTCPALASFGYREAVQVLEGTLTRAEFLSELIRKTKTYAKRQRTWFRTQVRPLGLEYTGSAQNRDLSMKMNDFLNKPPADLIYSPLNV